MKGYKGRNRRKEDRKKVEFATDIVRVNQLSWRGKKWDSEMGVNIGIDGFGCVSMKKLPDESSVSCFILFPRPFGTQLIEAEAKLIWQREKVFKGSPRWVHGFQFTKVSPSHLKLIEQVIEADC